MQLVLQSVRTVGDDVVLHRDAVGWLEDLTWISDGKCRGNRAARLKSMLRSV